MAESCLTNKTKATKANIEHQQWVYSETDAVLDDARPTQDADPRCQRPSNKKDVDWYAGDRWKAECTEESGNDQGEKRVSDEADGLHEGSRKAWSEIDRK